MYKKTIEYEDFKGNKRKEDFYFNLSKAELMEMELSTQAGTDEMIRMLIATKDHAKIVSIYKNLILKSYGIRSEDGTRFIKTDKLREEFEQTNAYSEFFIELLSSSEEQAKFINGVVSGSNLPNVSEEEALTKLRELGYDTSEYEEFLSKKESNVVPIETNAENHSST